MMSNSIKLSWNVSRFDGPDGPLYRAHIWTKAGYSTNTFMTRQAAESYARLKIGES